MTNITQAKLNIPIIMNGQDIEYQNKYPPNLKQIALPIYPNNARNAIKTPLTFLGIFLEKYPSKLTLQNKEQKAKAHQMI